MQPRRIVTLTGRAPTRAGTRVGVGVERSVERASSSAWRRRSGRAAPGLGDPARARRRRRRARSGGSSSARAVGPIADVRREQRQRGGDRQHGDRPDRRRRARRRSPRRAVRRRRRARWRGSAPLAADDVDARRGASKPSRPCRRAAAPWRHGDDAAAQRRRHRPTARSVSGAPPAASTPGQRRRTRSRRPSSRRSTAAGDAERRAPGGCEATPCWRAIRSNRARHALPGRRAGQRKRTRHNRPIVRSRTMRRPDGAHGELLDPRTPRRRRRRRHPAPTARSTPCRGRCSPSCGRRRRALTADPPGAVVVTGGERIFAAGADISEFGGPDEAGAITAGFHARARRHRRHPPLRDRRRERLRARRRLRAGAGVRLPHRRPAGRVRPARDPARHHPRRRRHAAPGPPGRPEPGQGAVPHRAPGARPRRRCASASPTSSSTATTRTRGR